MDRSDVAEALVVAGLRLADYVIDSWDAPVPGFFIDPDIVAGRGDQKLIVLVNASDSFFASQKKIWRNIEEPFEARVALGADVLCASVAFVTPQAENDLFRVSSRLFDANYILCKRENQWSSVLSLLDNIESVSELQSKQALADALLSNQVRAPSLIASAKSIAEFFRREIPTRSSLRQLWTLEIDRVKAVRAGWGQIFYESGNYDRKGVLHSSLLGINVLPQWEHAGLAQGMTAVIDPRKLPSDVFQDMLTGAKAISTHGLAKVFPVIGGRFKLSDVEEAIRLALRKYGAVQLQQALRGLIASHPDLELYITGARDMATAQAMGEHFLILLKRKSKKLITKDLLACSSNEEHVGIKCPRNWILDLLLLASKLNQTEVQRHCSIGRLTHAATGQMKMSLKQATEIVDYVFPHLPTSADSNDLAAAIMKVRLYSLETHSYANPLYALVRARLEALIERYAPRDRWSIDGYPERNSAVVRSWHTIDGSSAGQIKVQFLVKDKKTSRELVVRVGSCYDGNVGNKRKEVAAKGRVLSYEYTAGRFKRRERRLLILVLDGEWEAGAADPMRHIRMMHEAGWEFVLGPGSLKAIDDAWVGHFGAAK